MAEFDPFAEDTQVVDTQSVDNQSVDQQTQPAAEEFDPFSSEAIESEYEHITGDADSWFAIVKDPTIDPEEDAWGGIRVKVPDFNLDFLRVEPGEDPDPEKLTATESVRNSWNNFLDQISGIDERFSDFSYNLFGGREEISARAVDAKLEEQETRAGETIGFTDLDDIYDEQGIGGAIIGGLAATTNAVSSFASSAVISAATGGYGLALDMVSGSVRDYAKSKADEEGISYAEAASNLTPGELIVPLSLGAIAYGLEKKGLDDVGKVINGMAGPAKKALISTLTASGVEGGTEFFQSVIESFNRGLGRKKSLDDGLAEVQDFLKHDALETILQGAVGGGVSAGGGRAVRRAYSTIRSRAAERAIAENVDRISKIDEKLNDPNISNEEKRLLQRARTAIKGRLKEAIKEPDKLIKKLDDHQIEKINKLAEEQDRLVEEADQADVLADEQAGIVKEDINNRLQDNADKINKVLEGASDTNIRNNDGSIDPTSKASRKGQEIIAKTRSIYAKKGKEGVEDAVEANAPRIHQIANQLWNPAIAGKEQAYQKEDLIQDLNKAYRYLYNQYNPEKHGNVPIDAYINKYLKKVSLRDFDRGINKQFFQDLDDTGRGSVAETETTNPWDEVEIETVSLAQKLGLSKETKGVIVDAVKNFLGGPRQGSAGTQDFSTTFRDNLRAATADAVNKEFGKGKKFKEYVEKNWRTLANAVPQSTYAKRQGSTRGKLDPSFNWKDKDGNLLATKEDVVAYYTSPEVGASTRSDRKKTLAGIIGERVSGVAADQLLKAEGPTAKRFLEVQELVAEKGGIDTAIDFIDRAIAQLNRYVTQDTLNAGGIEAPIHVLIGGLRAVKAGLKGGKALAQAIEDGYKYVAEQVEGFTNEAWNKYFVNTLNQYSINKAALQEALKADDLEGPSADGMWKKIAGVKVPRLSVFTRQPKGTTKEEFDALLDQKHADNKAFFEKNLDLYLEHLPKGFWLMLGNYGKDGKFQKNASMLDEATINEYASKAKDDGLNWSNDDAMARIKSLVDVSEAKYTKAGKLKKHSVLSLAQQKEYNDEIDNNQAALFAFGDAIQAIYKANPRAKADLAALTRSFLNPDRSTANIFRRAARLMGYSGNLKNAFKRVPEHNPPAGYIAMATFEYAIKGQFNQEFKDAVKEKFGYWQIDHVYDPKGAFIANATKDFDLLTDNPNARYYAAPEVDITQMFYLNGDSVAQREGIPADIIQAADNNADLAEAIKQAVVSKTASKATQAEIDAFLNEAIDAADVSDTPVAHVASEPEGILGRKLSNKKKAQALVYYDIHSTDKYNLSEWTEKSGEAEDIYWSTDAENLSTEDDAMLDSIGRLIELELDRKIFETKEWQEKSKEYEDEEDAYEAWLDGDLKIDGKDKANWDQFIGDYVSRAVANHLNGKESPISSIYGVELYNQKQKKAAKANQSRFVEQLQKAWPGVKVFTTEHEAVQALIEEKGWNEQDARSYIRGVNGFVSYGNYIYLKPDRPWYKINNTAVHEFGHVWSRALFKQNHKLWQKGVAALINSPYWDEQVIRLEAGYKDLKFGVPLSAFPKEVLLKELLNLNPDTASRTNKFFQIFDEALAGAIGDRSERLLHKAGNEASAWENFLEGFTNFIKNIFGLQSDPRTADEFLDLGISEILAGSAADTHLANHIRQRNDRNDAWLDAWKGYDLKEDFEIAKRKAAKEKVELIKDLKDAGIYEEGDENRPNSSLEKKLTQYYDKFVDALSVNNGKLRVFDFDDTLAHSDSKTLYTLPDGTSGELTAEEFAKQFETLQAQGAQFDFSQFNEVINGRKGPLYQFIKNIQEKRGVEGVYILTARPAESALAIQEFLKGVGVYLPIENITGLADGSPEAKARWMAEKVKEGYSDIFFGDDAPQNVKAVKKALEGLKTKTWTAPLASEVSLSDQFNDIANLGYKQPSKEAAQRKGAEVDTFKFLGRRFSKLRFFVPPSAEDFEGLMYKLYGKGDTVQKFMEQYLYKPFAEANAALISNRQTTLKRVGKLRKAYEAAGLTSAVLEGKVPGTKISVQDAIRAYLQSNAGQEDINGLPKTTLEKAVKYVDSLPDLKSFALTLGKRVGADGELGYPTTKEWNAGTIDTDVINWLENGFRGKALAKWQENVDQIFSKENLNKLEAIHGTKWRKAVEDSLRRMKSGKNRAPSGSAETDRFLDFLNGSVGATMFFNIRSGVTQLISTVNFIGLEGNNIFKAAKAFANQPQYWSDVAKLLNSDYLVDRRGGNKFNIETNEINDIARSKNSYARFIGKLLQKGFTPTRIADSLAIALGGASWYRNAIAGGMSEKEAMLKFQEIAEKNQQSSRPDRISSVQASPLGRLIFAFANTPLQYARITKKAVLDLANGRGKVNNNLARIAWYGALQGVIFGAIQNALFAGLIGGDDDEEEKEQTKKNTEWAIKSYIGSFLKGWGLPGAIAGTGLEVAHTASQEWTKGSDLAIAATSISPPLNTKLRQLGKAWKNLKGTTYEDLENIFDRDSKTLEGIGRAAAVFNLPLDRAIYISNSLRDAFQADLTWQQRMALIMGYNSYQLGLENTIKNSNVNDPFDFTEPEEGGFDPFTEGDDEFDPFAEGDDEWSPFNRDEAGQILNDGTIQVDPNLSPLEREKTIKHEMEHLRQMQEDGLDYDDRYVYYKGNKHLRRNGKIKYKGKWHEEGGKGLPWEAAAYRAE